MSKVKVKLTKEMGRGVFACKAFRRGEKIEVSPCIKWDREDERLIQDSYLRFYVFSDDAGGSVLALGNGSLFNHDWKPNVTYKYDPSTSTMVFKVTRKIESGEQLFVNYGYDPVEKSDHWTKVKRAKAQAKKELDETNAMKAQDLYRKFWDDQKPSWWSRIVQFILWNSH